MRYNVANGMSEHKRYMCVKSGESNERNMREKERREEENNIFCLQMNVNVVTSIQIDTSDCSQ